MNEINWEISCINFKYDCNQRKFNIKVFDKIPNYVKTQKFTKFPIGLRPFGLKSANVCL